MGQMAGVAGLEPTNDGVKVRCLTAWLYPIIQDLPFIGLVSKPQKNGEPTGIRTPDTRLRRPLLYPTELWTRKFPNCLFKKIGADDENRTHAISLEG